MAHELAHVEYRDTLTMTITATLAGAISMLGNFAMFFGGGNRENNNPLGFIGILVAMIVAPFAAMIVQMAISRTREYAADRRGAQICGNPLWLASALNKIARGARQIVNEDAERNPASAPLFIINPLSGRGADSLFSTHPSTENRIAALEAMAQEFRQDACTFATLPCKPVSRRRGDTGRPPLALGSRWRRAQRPVGMSVEHGTKRPFGKKPKDYIDAEERPGLAARQCATRLLGAVIEKHTSLDGLTDNGNGHPQYMELDDRDRSLVRAILGAALRNRGTIKAAIARMIDRPLPENAIALRHLLHVAAAQDPLSRSARPRCRRSGRDHRQ